MTTREAMTMIEEVVAVHADLDPDLNEALETLSACVERELALHEAGPKWVLGESGARYPLCGLGARRRS